MSKRVFVLISMLVGLSMLFTACAPAPAPEPPRPSRPSRGPRARSNAPTPSAALMSAPPIRFTLRTCWSSPARMRPSASTPATASRSPSKTVAARSWITTSSSMVRTAAAMLALARLPAPSWPRTTRSLPSSAPRAPARPAPPVPAALRGWLRHHFARPTRPRT